MAWKQVVNFDVKKMGTQPGMCEKNVRLGYGLPAKCASAKEDMEYNKSKGALHSMKSYPTNVAVPVFVDTSSKYEHIEVIDHGTFYSDGKKVSNPMKQKFFGWGEFCAKARVVEWQDDPAPTPPTPPEPSGFNVGDKVTLENWVDYNGTPLKQTRDYYFISQINGDRAVLNADSVNGTVYAAVNTNNLVKYSGGGSGDIEVGDKVVPIQWVDYYGTPLKKTRDYYFVSQISGDRVVINADSVNGVVYAAMKKSNLKEV